MQRLGNDDVTDEADDVTEYRGSKKAQMGGDVLHCLIDIARNHQLRLNKKLSVADRIEQVGEAGDQRCLTQGNAIVGFCCGYRLHWLAPCDGFAVSGPLVEFSGNCAVPHQEQNR